MRYKGKNILFFIVTATWDICVTVIRDPNFMHDVILEKGYVYDVLNRFWGKKEEGGVGRTAENEKTGGFPG